MISKSVALVSMLQLISDLETGSMPTPQISHSQRGVLEAVLRGGRCLEENLRLGRRVMI